VVWRTQAEGGAEAAGEEAGEAKEIPHLFAPGRLLYLRQTSGVLAGIHAAGQGQSLCRTSDPDPAQHNPCTHVSPVDAKYSHCHIEQLRRRFVMVCATGPPDAAHELRRADPPDQRFQRIVLNEYMVGHHRCTAYIAALEHLLERLK